jgi:hypothetical protein
MMVGLLELVIGQQRLMRYGEEHQWAGFTMSVVIDVLLVYRATDRSHCIYL